MKKLSLAALAGIALLHASDFSRAEDLPSVSRIAFGSCVHQDRPVPIWSAVNEARPDVWIWLGDNVYADTADPSVFAEAYGKVKSNSEYAVLRGRCRVLGIWDDHDFGLNNGGRDWAGKEVAKTALLDFLDEPQHSPRRTQPGIQWAHDFGSGLEKVRLILVDNRYFRGNPKQPGADLFGAEQRAWLERQLASNDAAVTLVASGIQVIPEDHKYEKWADFPESRQWFFEQIREHDVPNVIFLSGDRHIAEISSEQPEGHKRPLYDITSSSMTHSWEGFPGEPNRHRLGEPFARNNFGLIEIDWVNRVLKASIRDERGETALEQTIAF